MVQEETTSASSGHKKEMNKGDRADGKAAKKKYKPKALIPTEFSSTDQRDSKSW